ncbi:MAG: putative F420-dependent oxidoreductase [Halieaceae bacterium]|jgi:probable F420-dependent oxidoreductase
MTLRKRTALSLPAPSGTVADTLAMAKQAEAMGYDDVWLADAGGLDALTLVPMILGNTEKLRVGIAVVPVYTRTPGVLASTLSVICQTWPGRFIPGLGTSSHTIVENWHGLKFEKPLTRMTETVSLLRSMLAGEKTAFAGKTLSSRGYRQLPVENVPIYLAALRPKMIERAAAIGDGVILNLFPRSALPRIMEHVAAGAEQAGKDPATVEVVCRHMMVVSEDKAAGRAAFRGAFSSYYSTPVYNKFLAWAGYEDAAREIREGWAAKDRERTAAALPDELVDEIGLIGTESECQQLIRDYATGGIHTHIVSCIYPTPEVFKSTAQVLAADRFKF